MVSKITDEHVGMGEADAAPHAVGGRGAAGWRIVYAMGVKPWDKNGVPDELEALVEGPQALPCGRALDLGCGGGTSVIYMARHGWDVTGIDYVAYPLSIARERAHTAGVQAHWVQGDVTHVGDLNIGCGYSLCLDAGCFHSFGAAERTDYAAGLAKVTIPGAHLLILAFKPAFRGPAPHGLSQAEIQATFAHEWELLWEHPAQGMRLPALLRNAAPSWYCLQRLS